MITVTKSLSYDVSYIVTLLRADLKREPDLDDVITMIEEWAIDDFSCGWGHQVKIRDLVFTDENGQEL